MMMSDSDSPNKTNQVQKRRHPLRWVAALLILLAVGWCFLQWQLWGIQVTVTQVGVHGLPDAFVAALCASSAACLRASAPCLTPLPDRLHEAKVPVPVQNVKIMALGLALPYRLFFTGAQWYTSPHAR